jgi:cytochrome b561
MTNIKNTKSNYGLISILLHWIMAVLIIGLFLSGVVMVELDYYSKWYNAVPWWHKSIGMCVLVLLVIRLIWLFNNIHPAPLASYKLWEIRAAKITHVSFYLLLIIISVSGYLISTAKSAKIDMFGWFEIEAMINFSKYQADIAGEFHEVAAYIMTFLFFLHICATFKHHFLDKDMTLIRMLKTSNKKEESS